MSVTGKWRLAACVFSCLQNSEDSRNHWDSEVFLSVVTTSICFQSLMAEHKEAQLKSRCAAPFRTFLLCRSQVKPPEELQSTSATQAGRGVGKPFQKHSGLEKEG